MARSDAEQIRTILNLFESKRLRSEYDERDQEFLIKVENSFTPPEEDIWMKKYPDDYQYENFPLTIVLAVELDTEGYDSPATEWEPESTSEEFINRIWYVGSIVKGTSKVDKNPETATLMTEEVGDITPGMEIPIDRIPPLFMQDIENTVKRMQNKRW